MRYVAFDPFKHLEYVESVLSVPISKATRGVVALDDQNKPCGVCLADGWTHTACNAHLAVQNPMCLRKLFGEFAQYVFITCDKQMMIGIVEETHVRALKLDKNIGFKEIYRLKDGYAPDVDQIIMRLNKADCRFLHKDYRLQEVA
jgi:hypothetical protein